MSGVGYVTVTLTRAQVAALAEALEDPFSGEDDTLSMARLHVRGAALAAGVEAVSQQ